MHIIARYEPYALETNRLENAPSIADLPTRHETTPLQRHGRQWPPWLLSGSVCPFETPHRLSDRPESTPPRDVRRGWGGYGTGRPVCFRVVWRSLRACAGQVAASMSDWCREGHGTAGGGSCHLAGCGMCCLEGTAAGHGFGPSVWCSVRFDWIADLY